MTRSAFLIEASPRVSFRFLHQPERVLWSPGRVLYADDVSDDVCGTQVRHHHLPPLSPAYGSILCSLNYLWQQGSGKFVPMTAPQYIDTVMSSIQIMLNDELLFPTNTSA